jgi:hypothetical protein
MRDKILIYSVGNEGGNLRNDLLKFDKLVEKNRLKTFEHAYKYYPSEDHMTEPIPAYYDALRFVRIGHSIKQSDIIALWCSPVKVEAGKRKRI